MDEHARYERIGLKMASPWRPNVEQFWNMLAFGEANVNQILSHIVRIPSTCVNLQYVHSWFFFRLALNHWGLIIINTGLVARQVVVES